MDSLPVFDYAPSTLLGITVLAILFGWLSPYRVVKQLLARIAYLESALAKEQEGRAEDGKTLLVVRRFFERLGEGAGL